MLSHDDVVPILRHMEWADALVLKAVLANEAARGDGLVLEKLIHLHTVQRAFLRLSQGEPLDLPKRDAFEDAEAAAHWASGCYVILLPYFENLGEADLSRSIVVPWGLRFTESRGLPPVHPTIGEAIYQFASHSTYHRGQVNSLIKRLGGEPPLTDFIAWLWLGRPPADWTFLQTRLAETK